MHVCWESISAIHQGTWGVFYDTFLVRLLFLSDNLWKTSWSVDVLLSENRDAFILSSDWLGLQNPSQAKFTTSLNEGQCPLPGSVDSRNSHVIYQNLHFSVFYISILKSQFQKQRNKQTTLKNTHGPQCPPELHCTKKETVLHVLNFVPSCGPLFTKLNNSTTSSKQQFKQLESILYAMLIT